MFESAELGQVIDQQAYEAALPELLEGLLEAQYELKRQARFPVLVLINGIEGAGKGETVKLLNNWMDPRLIQVETFDVPSDEERDHPPEWRYWRRLPPKGRIGVFFGNWYSQMLHARVIGELKDPGLEQAMDNAQRLERMLSDEGALIFKFWFHLSKEQMRQRLKQLAKDPLRRWRITPLDWWQSKTYDKFVRHGERVIRHTSRDYAPWYVIGGFDANYRSLSVGRILLNGMRAALERPAVAAEEPHTATLAEHRDEHPLLRSLDLSQSLSKADYKLQLATEQARLARLMRHKRMRRHALVAVFEGNDAAGKGGAVRRVVAALDPRDYRVVPIGTPTDEERAQPYLWRFWRHIPARGHFTLFDRSWYGRVLVERVEQLCSESDWLRAYGEINDFEENLIHHGVVLVKLWLAIDKDVQLQRFLERESTPHKRFKISQEDWRNREKWDQYADALCDMVERTSTALAPWTLVEANDKRFARVKVLRTINDALQRVLEDH